MLRVGRLSKLRFMLAAGAASAVAAGAALTATAQGKTEDVTITITRVKALDFIDWGIAGQADFYARVTLAGEVFKTPFVKGRDDIQPNWKITKALPKGRHDVKIEIYDKDVLKPDERVDINQVPNKRDLDFVINSRSCRAEGIKGSPKCGEVITRGGTEKKRAELSFTVSVGNR